MPQGLPPLIALACVINIIVDFVLVGGFGMGLIASASVGVVEKLIVFAMLPPTFFASEVVTMTAQNIGAGLGLRALS